MDEMILKMNVEVAEAKMNAAKDRLLEMNITVDLEEEAKKKFPRLRWFPEADGGESLYWNDLTEDGIRIITFKYAPTPIEKYGDTSTMFNVGVEWY